MTEPTTFTARRCLFGKPDRETIKRNKEDFYKTMKMEIEKKNQKWNFNFETDTPLEGRYQWEKIHGETQAIQDSTKEKRCEKCIKSTAKETTFSNLQGVSIVSDTADQEMLSS